MPLVDTHAHLDQEEFDADRDDVVRRAREAGVETIVAVGTTARVAEDNGTSEVAWCRH